MNKSIMLSCLAVISVFMNLGCEKNETAHVISPPAVGVMHIKAQNFPITNSYPAQTAGSRAVDIRAQVSGILVSRDYEEGSFVDEGQLLFQIEPDTYKAALKQAQGVRMQAQAAYTKTKRDWDRIQKLYAQNAVSQRDRDSALAAYEGAQADLFSAKAAEEEAKIKLNYAYVKSPIKGYAGKEQHSVGNLINSSSANGSLLTVVNKIDPIYVNFAYPSPQYVRMRTLTAQNRLVMDTIKASVSLVDGTKYPIEGKVVFNDKAVDPGTSVVNVRAEFSNPDLFVLPGQFVRVTLTGAYLKNAIMIPQQALLQTQNGTLAAVVNSEGKAEMRKVTLNINVGEWFLVDDGLKDGDILIVEGLNRAAPNQPVRIDDGMTKHVAETFTIPAVTAD